MSAPAKRRNNAPVRPRRPATGVPDLLFAFAAAALTMAVVFFIASFAHEDLSNGDAGTDIARIFAATLTLSAIFLFLLGMMLMRSDRNQLDHYVTPILLGIAVGALESWLFLNPPSPVILLAPLLLFVFVLRPVRRGLGSLFGNKGRR